MILRLRDVLNPIFSLYILRKWRFWRFYFSGVYPKIYVDKYPKTVECAFKCNGVGFCRKIGVHIGVLISELSIFFTS